MDTECKSESSTLDLNHHHHHHYHHLQSSINSTNSTISSASSISSNCSLSSSPQQHHTSSLIHMKQQQQQQQHQQQQNETLYMSSLSEASSPSVSSISSKHIDENIDQISHLSQSCQNINYLDSSMSDDMDGGNGGHHYTQMMDNDDGHHDNENENDNENEEMANNISLSNRTNRFFPDDVVDIDDRRRTVPQLDPLIAAHDPIASDGR